VLLLSLGPRGVAEDRAAPTDSGSVALNQPVSIDGTQAAAASAVTATPDTPANEAAGPDAALRRAKRPSRTSGGGDAARLARGVDGDARLSLAPSAPWYRSGLGALAVVLALIGGLVWALRRWVPATRSGESRIIGVVGRASLSPKHSAALIRVGRRFVLVGMTGEQVSALCEISEPEEVAELSIRTDTVTAQEAESFERLFIEEAADYRQPVVDEVKDAGLTAAETVRTRKPLCDLLRRLRTLQSIR
jgi:flagellar biogenesis protein FliO